MNSIFDNQGRAPRCLCALLAAVGTEGLVAEDKMGKTQFELPAIMIVAPPDVLQDVPAYYAARSTDTVTREQLESSRHANVTEHLRGLPGVTLTSATAGRAVDLKIRGVSSGQGTVTLDGVPLPTALPGLTWINLIPAEALGDVTVVRGPGHAWAPEQGLAGTVQLSSKRAGESEAQLHAEGGSFGTVRGSAHGGVADARGSLSLTAGYYQEFEGSHQAIARAGNPERDPFHSTIGLLHYDFAPSTGAVIDGSFVAKKAMQEADFPAATPDGQPAFVDGDTRFRESMWLTQHAVTTALASNWSSRLQFAYTGNNIHATAGPLAGDFNSSLTLANWRNRHALWESDDRKLALIWGGDTRYEEGEASSNVGPALEDDRHTLSGFGELQLATARWNHEVGLRLEGHQQFGARLLGHAASEWKWSPHWRLHANVGNAFRPPSVGERFIPFIGNPALMPEKGWTGDIGLEWAPSASFSATVTGFAGRYQNLAVNVIAPGQFYRYVNVPESRILGLETALRGGVSEALQAGVSYTYQDAENVDTDFHLPLRPRHSGQVWAEWRASALPVTLRVLVNLRSRHWSDLEETLFSEGVAHFGAMLSWKPSPHWDFYVRGENLSDDRTRDLFAYDSSGAAVFAGMHFSYF